MSCMDNHLHEKHFENYWCLCISLERCSGFEYRSMGIDGASIHWAVRVLYIAGHTYINCTCMWHAISVFMVPSSRRVESSIHKYMYIVYCSIPCWNATRRSDFELSPWIPIIITFIVYTYLDPFLLFLQITHLTLGP